MWGCCIGGGSGGCGLFLSFFEVGWVGGVGCVCFLVGCGCVGWCDVGVFFSWFVG